MNTEKGQGLVEIVLILLLLVFVIAVCSWILGESLVGMMDQWAASY